LTEKVQILSPKKVNFLKKGKNYTSKNGEEFGKGEFYLADSFNEMDVPLSKLIQKWPKKRTGQLLVKAVYGTIAEGQSGCSSG